MKTFDVVVLGGGHAGLEAAWIASQFELSVAIVTLPGVKLGSAPCNPAVGGVGKGQVVRELDALGGLMGRLADLAGIQFRTLNESKGYAVQSTRVQIDKDVYPDLAEKIIAEKKNISIIRSRVTGIRNGNQGIFELLSDDGSGPIGAVKLIVTTGTFLAGKLHVGSSQSDGGRVGCKNSYGMNRLFGRTGEEYKRFKTGTPPRILSSSLNYKKFIEQKSDPASINFHYDHDLFDRKMRQVSCFLARTNEKTMRLIRDSRKLSPLFNGQIKGIGPRYCPSIEDKAFRYTERNTHHIFVEPEGLDSDLVYPNGISTSLPKDVQLDFIRTIDGFEDAEIAVAGYAVEYDVINTSNLDLTLQSKEVNGLYFAGQVNGTSGYEEAAGQGFIAGCNASLSLKCKKQLVLDRNDSYIGVMIDDLVSASRDEPYRLFTARSENRLYLREDNSYTRMLPYRKLLGLDLGIDRYLQQYQNQAKILEDLLLNLGIDYSIDTLGKNGPIGAKLEELVKSCLNPVEFVGNLMASNGLCFDPRVLRESAVNLRYKGYIKRTESKQKKLSGLYNKSVDWKSIVGSKNISNECRQRVEAMKPLTFGHLAKIEGIRPATLTYIAHNLI